MSGAGDNRKIIGLELTPEQADFLYRNCDTNMTFGLNFLIAKPSDEGARKMVALIEQFRGLRNALEAAGVSRPPEEEDETDGPG